MINGINSIATLNKTKEYIRRVRKITLGGTILPDTITHLQLVSGQITQQEAANNSKALIGLINNFMTIKTLIDLRTTFDSFINNIANLITEMTESSFRARDSILNEIKKSEDAIGFRVLLSRPPNDEYTDIMAPYFFSQRYNLNVDYLPEKRTQIFLKFPSIKYMCNIYWIYFAHLAISNAKPKESDIFDMAQIIYLNIADYFVTRDKRLRDRINRPDNPDLYKRAVSPQEFISMLRDTNIAKRAPQSASSIWIDAPF
jgi:hypothetical protein